jgi:hypothetical protein
MTNSVFIDIRSEGEERRGHDRTAVTAAVYLGQLASVRTNIMCSKQEQQMNGEIVRFLIK